MTCLSICLALAGPLGPCPLPTRGQEPTSGAPGALCGVELELPARAGARWPSLTSGADGRLYATWIEASEEDGEGPAVLAVARLEGERWQRLSDAAAGRGWFVNWADLPALAALADGTLAASFLVQNGESTYAYEVQVVLSRDGGASWSEPVRLHGDTRPAEHGFVSLEPLGEGAERFGAVWLDGRATPSGPMALWARAVERDGRLGEEFCLDERVCDCCQTAAVARGDALVVAYRDRGADELRDISWLTLGPDAWPDASSGGVRPEVRPLAPDGWKIAGCPVNGPALAACADELAAAWFTLGSDGRPRVLVRRVGQPAGEAGEAVETILVSDVDPLGRVDLAFEGTGGTGALWVTWLENRGEQAEWTAARLAAGAEGADPAPMPLARVASSGRDVGFGRLACTGDALYFAWTDAGPTGERPAVRTLCLARPSATSDPDLGR